MIVVVGVTGNTGSALVGELVAAKAPFRAVARDVARAKAMLGPSAEVVRGDLDEPETLEPALRGAERVFAAIGRTPNLVTNEKALIDAAARAGVRHYVKLSGFHVAPDAPAMVQRAHAEIEAHLAASGMARTILGGNFFFQNFLGMAGAIANGVMPAPTADAKAAIVDTRDIARVAARVLTSDGHDGKRYVLTGGEALSHGDAAAIFSDVLKRPIRHVDVPPEGFAQGLEQAGLPPWFTPILTDVYVQLWKGGLAGELSGDVERLTGRAPTSLATFVRDHAATFGG